MTDDPIENPPAAASWVSQRNVVPFERPRPRPPATSTCPDCGADVGAPLWRVDRCPHCARRRP
jgi:transposase